MKEQHRGRPYKVVALNVGFILFFYYNAGCAVEGSGLQKKIACGGAEIQNGKENYIIDLVKKNESWECGGPDGNFRSVLRTRAGKRKKMRLL